MEIFNKSSLNNKSVKQYNKNINSDEIKYAPKSQAKLDNLTPPLNLDTSKSSLKKLLLSAGLALNEQNINILLGFISNDIPLNQQNLKKMNQQMQLFNLNSKDQNSKNINKGLFVLKNNMPITTSNTITTENIAKDPNYLLKLFNKLADNIATIKDKNVKDDLIKNLLLKQNSDSFQSYSPNDNTNTINKNNHTNNEGITYNKDVLPQKNNYKTLDDLKIEKKTQLTKNLLVTNLPEALEKQHTKALPHVVSNINNSNETVKEKMNALVSTPEKIPQVNIIKEKATNLTVDNLNVIKQTNQQSNLVTTTNISTTTKEQILNAISQNYNFNFNAPKQHIDTTFNSLYENINNMLQLAHNNGQTDITETLTQIKDTLNFLQNIKETIYIPLPLVINNQNTEGELYVFKDKSKKNKQSTSALLSLNTANLGKIETFIQKADEKISLQFRLENIQVKKLILSNINRLKVSLNLSNVTFLPIEEPFNIIYHTTNKSEINLNYSFDIKA